MASPEIEAGVGWRVRATSPPRLLAGANGLRFGPDDALYCGSAFGSSIARIDVDGGGATLITSDGDGIVSPDDLAFGPDGTLYVAECMNGRVSAWSDGEVSVSTTGLIGPNGIDIFEGRVFIDEFRPGGRLMEVFGDGREPIVLAENLQGPNGLAVAPDRMIYFSHLLAGEVCRAPIDGGPVEVMCSGLKAPNSVRLGPDGLLYICVGGGGEVLTLDPRTGRTRTIARVRDGMDSLAVSRDGRVFLSYYLDGSIVEVVSESEVCEWLSGGLLGPFGLATAGEDVYIADGMALSTVTPDGETAPRTKVTDEGFPGFGFLRTLGTAPGGLVTTLTDGRIVIHDPVAVASEQVLEGLEEPTGVAVAADGSLRIVESGAGRLLAQGPDGIQVVSNDFDRPLDICDAGDGGWLVSDEERGEVVRVDDRGKREFLLGGLSRPQGLVRSGEQVLVVEAGARRVIASSLGGAGKLSIVATGLPIGLGGGEPRPPLNGLPEVIDGPISSFAGITMDGSGRVYVGCDAIGAVTVLERAE